MSAKKSHSGHSHQQTRLHQSPHAPQAVPCSVYCGLAGAYSLIIYSHVVLASGIALSSLDNADRQGCTVLLSMGRIFKRNGSRTCYVLLTSCASCALCHPYTYCNSRCSSLAPVMCHLFCIVQECVIYNGADYVVIHKPAGVQVAPTVDNLLENVLFCTAQVSQAAFIRPYFGAHVPLVHTKDAFSALVPCLIEWK